MNTISSLSATSLLIPSVSDAEITLEHYLNEAQNNIEEGIIDLNRFESELISQFGEEVSYAFSDDGEVDYKALSSILYSLTTDALLEEFTSTEVEDADDTLEDNTTTSLSSTLISYFGEDGENIFNEDGSINSEQLASLLDEHNLSDAVSLSDYLALDFDSGQLLDQYI